MRLTRRPLYVVDVVVVVVVDVVVDVVEMKRPLSDGCLALAGRS